MSLKKFNQEDIDMIDPNTEVSEDEVRDVIEENISQDDTIATDTNEPEPLDEETKSIAEYVDELPVEDLVQFEEVGIDNPPLDTAGDIAFTAAKESEWNRVHTDLYNDVRSAVNILSTVLQVLNKYQYQPENITEEDTKKFQTNLEMYNKIFNKEFKLSTEDFTESSFHNYVELLNSTLAATSEDLDTIKTKLATAYEGLSKEIESLEFEKYKKYLSELRVTVSDSPVNIVNIVDHMIEATVAAIEEDKTILENEEGLKSKIYNIVKHHAYLITDNNSASAGDAMNTINVLTEEDINKLIQVVLDYVKITSNRQCASNCLVDPTMEFDTSVYNDKITTAIASSITKVLPKYITLVGDLINNILTKPAISVESDLKVHVLDELNEYLRNFFKSLEAEELKPKDKEGAEYPYTPIWIFHKTGCYGFDGNEKLNKINMENGITVPSMNFPKFKLISTLLENIDIKKGVLTEYPTSTLKLIESNLLTVKSDEKLANVVTVLSILTVMGDIYRDVVVNTIFNTQKEIAEISYGYHAIIKAVQEVREGDKTPTPINNTDGSEPVETTPDTPTETEVATEEPVEETTETVEDTSITQESILIDLGKLYSDIADIRALQYHNGSEEDKRALYRKVSLSLESIEKKYNLESNIVNLEYDDINISLEGLGNKVLDTVKSLIERMKTSREETFANINGILLQVTNSIENKKKDLLELKEKLLQVGHVDKIDYIVNKFNTNYAPYLDPHGGRVESMFKRLEESLELFENVSKDRLDFVKPFDSIKVDQNALNTFNKVIGDSKLESIAPITFKVSNDIVRVYASRTTALDTKLSDISLDKFGIDLVRDNTLYRREVLSAKYKSTSKLNMSFNKDEAIKLIDQEIALLDKISKKMNSGISNYLKSIKTRIEAVFSNWFKFYTLQWRKMSAINMFHGYYLSILSTSTMSVEDAINQSNDFISNYARAILKMSKK